LFGKYISKEIELTHEVKDWIKNERVNRLDNRSKNSFIDLTIIIIAFGAFGSLLYLTKVFIENKHDNIAMYIFRPFLGMFLGLSTFMVYMFTHVLVSSSSVYNIRKESLYVLALASGLVSEQAYSVVVTRAKQILDKLKTGPKN
jgi:hypothetical protein